MPCLAYRAKIWIRIGLPPIPPDISHGQFLDQLDLIVLAKSDSFFPLFSWETFRFPRASTIKRSCCAHGRSMSGKWFHELIPQVMNGRDAIHGVFLSPYFSILREASHAFDGRDLFRAIFRGLREMKRLLWIRSGSESFRWQKIFLWNKGFLWQDPSSTHGFFWV